MLANVVMIITTLANNYNRFSDVFMTKLGE